MIPSSRAVSLALAGLFAGTVQASPVTYTDHVQFMSVTIGSTVHTCSTTSDPDCAFITFRALGDTADAVRYDVPGAVGYKSVVHGVSVEIAFLGGSPTVSLDLLPDQLYVSVDQTNGGAGFGSAFGPTYPAATYGGSADYAHYDLSTDFFAFGFSGFCPDVPLCDKGAALHTSSGDDVTIAYAFRPNRSIFTATVSPATLPEPPVSALLAGGLLALGWRRSRRT